MPPIEVRKKFRSMNVIPRLPRIVFHPVPLPLDKEPQFPVDHLGVQDLLNDPFLFSVDELRRRRWFRTTSGDGIRGGWCQLDDIENGMKAA